jgi:hypothetical protein
MNFRVYYMQLLLLALMKIRAYGSKALHAVINLRGVSTN